MLDGCYIKIVDKMICFKAELDLLKDYVLDNSGFENRIAYRLTENIGEQLLAVVYEIKRLSYPAVEGRLLLDKNHGSLFVENGNRQSHLSRGDYLEILGDDGNWYTGVIDKVLWDNQSGYYFYNAELGNPVLSEGMICRVRMEA